MRYLLLYVVIGLAFVGAIILLTLVHPSFSQKWSAFVFFTALLVIVLAKMYWSERESAKLRISLILVLSAHITLYVAFLTHVENWPALNYVLTMPIEVMVIMSVIKVCLNVFPRNLKGL
jgi:hypothetical protein